MIPCRPFVKWAGGKTQLLPELLPRIPRTYGRYFEPFIGSGALFFALQPARASLSDSNAELMNVYEVVRDHLEPLLEDLSQHMYDKDYYYLMRNADRSGDYASWSPVRRAARLVYLNKTCFNGLYRVNRRGQFNVPFGRYKNPTICDTANLTACHRALAPAELSCRAFTETEHAAQSGDFIYFDPPYAPLNATSNFTGYEPGGFGKQQQHELKEMCDRLSKKGVLFMLSNSFTQLAMDLYKHYHCEVVTAARAINSRASKRGRISELIVRNY